MLVLDNIPALKSTIVCGRRTESADAFVRRIEGEMARAGTCYHEIRATEPDDILYLIGHQGNPLSS